MGIELKLGFLMLHLLTKYCLFPIRRSKVIERKHDAGRILGIELKLGFPMLNLLTKYCLFAFRHSKVIEQKYKFGEGA